MAAAIILATGASGECASANVHVDVQVDTDQPKNKKSKSNKGKNLKIENREIDPEIIRRARLEDDEY